MPLLVIEQNTALETILRHFNNLYHHMQSQIDYVSSNQLTSSARNLDAKYFSGSIFGVKSLGDISIISEINFGGIPKMPVVEGNFCDISLNEQTLKSVSFLQ